MLDGFLSLEHRLDLGRRRPSSSHFFNFRPYAVAVLIVVVAALWLGRLRMAVAVGVVFLGANLTTQAPEAPDRGPEGSRRGCPDASLPSGHVTAATSLALCVVLVAPVGPAAVRRRRRAASACSRRPTRSS